MPDIHSNAPPQTLSAPMRSGFAITPTDGVDLTNVTRAIYITTGGAVSVQWADGTNQVLTLPAGYFEFRWNRVNSSGTTAAGMLGFF